MVVDLGKNMPCSYLFSVRGGQLEVAGLVRCQTVTLRLIVRREERKGNGVKEDEVSLEEGDEEGEEERQIAQGAGAERDEDRASDQV